MASKEELSAQLEVLRKGKMAPDEMYHTIHEFGRENFREARPVVETFLTSDDPELRYIALEVLTRHWRLMEHWDTARKFLEHDSDSNCRMKGASSLEVLKRNTQDSRTLAVLAHVVRNAQENRIVREVAYAAMKGILHYDPREQFAISSKGLDLERDVDWNVVDSYL